MSKKIPISIIGATGYTGIELARILSNHPQVEIKSLVARQAAGQIYSDLFPAFKGKLDFKIDRLNPKKISEQSKAVFLCLPHHESMNTAAQFRKRGLKVIDLSADFRLKDLGVYESVYGKHSQKKLAKEAVYGLPEFHRKEIKKTSLVSCPGCYPTSILLALGPLLQSKMISNTDIICDSKSGVSGAGRSLKMTSLYGEVNENFKAYSIGTHRHSSEIKEKSTELYGEDVSLIFSPHLLPLDRGIHSTIYAKASRKWKTKKLIQTMKEFYKKEPFVEILDEGQFPQIKNVRGTNNCQISILYDDKSERVVLCSAIDNLVKGASGQAVQCFNLMYGFNEKIGLEFVGLIP